MKWEGLGGDEIVKTFYPTQAVEPNCLVRETCSSKLKELNIDGSFSHLVLHDVGLTPSILELLKSVVLLYLWHPLQIPVAA